MPLAERMRPRNIAEFVGQHQTVGEGSLIRHAIETDGIFSMILWGPPGCGKTTLARIIAGETRSHFVHFSAVLSGVKEIRAVIEEARNQQKLYRKRTILFVDEIHRFNKAQQDAFLHHVESGLITLIGATTENPSFEVIAPLLSRCRVITLVQLSKENISAIIELALDDVERGLGELQLKLAAEAREHIIRISEGDARVALNSLEVAASLVMSKQKSKGAATADVITLEDAEAAIQQKALVYDKAGEEHYNIISALHKSLRGSDPDAALYWLHTMIGAGEDPKFIARRLVILASEDVGLGGLPRGGVGLTVRPQLTLEHRSGLGIFDASETAQQLGALPGPIDRRELCPGDQRVHEVVEEGQHRRRLRQVATPDPGERDGEIVGVGQHDEREPVLGDLEIQG